jgi:hypothetical protein
MKIECSNMEVQRGKGMVRKMEARCRAPSASHARLLNAALELSLSPSLASTLPSNHIFLSCLAQMPSKSDLTPWISGINLATSVAEAVPVFGAPVKGSLDIVKQILESAQVNCFRL